MAFDATILARIREYVGSTPDDAAVEATFNLAGNGTAETAALSILRTRRADLLAKPAEFNVEGDYSQNTGRNLDALNAQIVGLEALCGVGDQVMQTGYMTRCAGR